MRIKLKWLFNSRSLEYIIQLLIVMVGVFLGMLVSDWKATQNLNKSRNQILLSIKSEIESNREIIIKSDEKLSPFFTSLDSIRQYHTPALVAEFFYDRPFNERLPNWTGIGGQKLSGAMFETAKYSNVIPGMDVKLLEQLAKIYNLQEDANELRATFLDQFLAIDSETKYSDVLRLVSRIRQELGGINYILLNEYNQVLTMIGPNE